MLLRLEVANHRSIGAPVELSMIAVDEDRPAARKFELLNEHVLTVAGVYGANASGKSNVLAACAWLSDAVRHSLRSWTDVIPREPFKFGEGPFSSSRFEIDMLVEGVRYAYQIEFDDSTVLHEALYSYPKRQPRTLFEREDADLSLRRGLGRLSGVRELLTPTTLVLSAAMRFDEPEVRPFARALAGIGTLGLDRRRAFHATAQMFPAEPAGLQLPDGFPIDAALELLRFADLGINDIDVGERPIVNRDGTVATQPHIRLVHQVGEQLVPFDSWDESDGTLAWFALIAPVLNALGSGQVLLFDEIDASLHPKLSARLVELFQDPATNPAAAQLIFTTHDTSLLNHLNRDEVWLTEKGPSGATSLTALAEFGGDKVRRSLNLERAYLQGRFGGVPELDQQRLRRALGLVA
ncbi:AAA family ATPase [Dactylosporangium sp. CA-139066]|uniref:AAA family ATPase n=1 Tax=Dactylosporangium sp. CA-139066 TaxID=3239930 RepID=UPI003D8DD71D